MTTDAHPLRAIVEPDRSNMSAGRKDEAHAGADFGAVGGCWTGLILDPRLDIDQAVMGLDQPFCYRQAKPGSFPIAGKMRHFRAERPKEPRPHEHGKPRGL